MIIPLMDYNTCKILAISADQIRDIMEGCEVKANRSYPYSDVHIVNESRGIDRVVRVVESKAYIERQIEESKHAKVE